MNTVARRPGSRCARNLPQHFNGCTCATSLRSTDRQTEARIGAGGIDLAAPARTSGQDDWEGDWDDDWEGQWDPETDEALTYLRAMLDGDPAPATGPPVAQPTARPAAPVPVVTGAAMPPLTFVGRDPIDPTRVRDVQQDHGPKPLGGLWTTVGDAADPTPTPWEKFLASNPELRADPQQRSSVTLRPDARVARIASLDDFRALATECPNDPDWDNEWVEAFGIRAARPLDWSKVAERYDAVWVTDEAIRQSNSAPPEQAAGPSGGRLDLGMWDFESVVVLNRNGLA